MKNNFIQEIVISSALIILLVLFLNPFEFWMPDAMVIMMILGLIVIFSFFSVYVWKENAKDERENLHSMIAGKSAFLIGAGVLVLGIIVKSLRHEIDFWLILTLVAMILAKIGGIIYGRIKN